MSFLVLWFISWSSFLVHLRMAPEYFTRGTAQVFVSLMRFLLCGLVLSSFLVVLGYLKKNFLSSLLVWWCPLPILSSIRKFPFLRAFWFMKLVSGCAFHEYVISLAPSLLQIVIVIAHLPEVSLSGFSPQLSFFLLLSFPLSSFP